MTSGLLSLKWNNHKSTFFHVLSTIRLKESYCDVTLACEGRFYALHKFVLSTCSEYFEEMFERTQCKHPVIVLKDIKSDDLEALLNYMYVGEVNVVQEKLAGLIKAAECLKIKGLAVPDEDPLENDKNVTGREQHKRAQRSEDSPRAKRRRRENSSDLAEDNLNTGGRSRQSSRTRDSLAHQPKNNSSSNISSNEHIDNTDTREDDGENRQDTDSNTRHNRENTRTNSSHKKEAVPEEVLLDDDNVKSEPIELDHGDEGAEGHDGDGHEDDNKDALHQELGFDASDSMGADENYSDVDPSMLGDQGQSMDDVVGQALPGSSGFQGNSFSLWEGGDGNMSNFANESYSGDNGGSQARQLMQRSPMDDSSSDSTAKRRHSNDSSNLFYFGADFLHSKTSHSTSHEAFRQATPGGLESSIQQQNNTKLKSCPYCSYWSPSKYNLVNHIRTHSGEKPFACPYCPFRAVQKSTVENHIKRHTGEKPFECTFCSHRTTRKSLLNDHVKKWHGDCTAAAAPPTN